jgi:hypothetical protein
VTGSTPRLRAGPVYREIAATCRVMWPLLLATALIVFVPLGLLDALDERVGSPDVDELTVGAILGLLVLALAHTASATLGEVFYSGVVAAAVIERRAGTRRPLLHIARTLPYRRLVVVDVLFVLIVMAGVLLLIVPGLVFLTWFAMAGPVVEIERRGAIPALRRSRELVRGTFWPVFAVVIPIGLVTDALTDAASALATWAVGDTLVVDWAGAVLAGVLVAPLYAVAVVVLAYRLIERKMAPSRGRRPIARRLAGQG